MKPSLIVWNTVKHDIWVLFPLLLICYVTWQDAGFWGLSGWSLSTLLWISLMSEKVSYALRNELNRLQQNQ